jgi:hypothetical protein
MVEEGEQRVAEVVAINISEFKGKELLTYAQKKIII